MRTIKFRAWDGAKMHYPRVFEFGINAWNNETSMAFENNGGMLTTSYIMQWTNLKDINAIDIYEGDIIKDEYDRVLLVEWYKYGFCFKALTKTNFVRAFHISEWFDNDSRYPEIVGNVYEASELCEGKEHE